MTTLRCVVGDITQSSCDAIVNAADSRLSGGADVDGAIHRAAGADFTTECHDLVRSQGECATGDAVITAGGDLQARYVIHTVGPVWQSWQEWGCQLDEVLGSCYRGSLDLAAEHSLASVAFPNISTGVYNFPPRTKPPVSPLMPPEIGSRHKVLMSSKRFSSSVSAKRTQRCTDRCSNHDMPLQTEPLDRDSVCQTGQAIVLSRSTAAMSRFGDRIVCVRQQQPESLIARKPAI